MAVGTARRILVGDKPHDEVFAVHAAFPVAQVEAQRILHGHGHRIFIVAQTLVKPLHDLAAQGMIHRHQHLRAFVKPPVGTILPTAEMGRHSDPVAAVHGLVMFVESLHRQHRAGLFFAHMGHIDRIDEYLGQRPVEIAADDGQLPDALFRERIAQVFVHDLHAVTQAVVEYEKEQVLDDVIFEPVRQHGKETGAEPQRLQPYLLCKIQLSSFHPARR